MTTLLFEYPDVRDWRDMADCRTVGPDVFFKGSRSYKEARRICNTCPVKAECLESAQRVERGLSKVYRHGVYGALTPEERVKLSKERGERQGRNYELEDIA